MDVQVGAAGFMVQLTQEDHDAEKIAEKAKRKE